jgi:hypothetical protein
LRDFEIVTINKIQDQRFERVLLEIFLFSHDSVIPINNYSLSIGE